MSVGNLFEMTETNSNGDKKISVKWIHPDNYDHLKETAKKLNLSETTIINQALKLHREESERDNAVRKFNGG